MGVATDDMLYESTIGATASGQNMGKMNVVISNRKAGATPPARLVDDLPQLSGDQQLRQKLMRPRPGRKLTDVNLGGKAMVLPLYLLRRVMVLERQQSHKAFHAPVTAIKAVEA